MNPFVCSAIKIWPAVTKPYPMIICGKRHSDCIAIIAKLGLERSKTSDVQGFITVGDIFVDRSDAAAIAKAYGYDLRDNDMLYSEDIWPPGKASNRRNGDETSGIG